MAAVVATRHQTEVLAADLTTYGSDSGVVTRRCSNAGVVTREGKRGVLVTGGGLLCLTVPYCVRLTCAEGTVHLEHAHCAGGHCESKGVDRCMRDARLGRCTLHSLDEALGVHTGACCAACAACMKDSPALLLLLTSSSETSAAPPSCCWSWPVSLRTG